MPKPTLTIRISEEARDAVAAAAEAEGRSSSSWIERAVIAALKAGGYLPESKPKGGKK